jgi:formylglycine-generating enzyme required for sulfatase activity
MWVQMVERGDGILRLPPATMELGGVLAERANAFLATHPNSEKPLRRVLTLRLATVREDGEPTRRRALRSEFSEEEWLLVSELADQPNRLLVITTSEQGQTYAEVAHEAIFRRWERLREWIAQEREFLLWRSDLESAHRRWQGAVEQSRDDALLMGLSLVQAQSWLANRAEDLTNSEVEFIKQSARRDATEREQQEGLRRRTRQMAILAGVLTFGIGAGLAWSSRDYLKASAVTLVEAIWPRTLSAEAERALKPGQVFKECAHCPEMVMVPAGEFMMGSPADETGHQRQEEPQHKVTIEQPYAVSRFEVTSAEWDYCVVLGGCTWPAPETGWGRGRRPVMNVGWDDAKQYVAWLSRRLGKPYRLLSEAEWEYAARAGSDKAYAWGEEIGENRANCKDCGSRWDGRQTAPVGSFAANEFGLHDMHGNVWEWVEDCYHDNYKGAPGDSLAWTANSDCSRRVLRGGSWVTFPPLLRAADRVWDSTDNRGSAFGFRVGRTLSR